MIIRGLEHLPYDEGTEDCSAWRRLKGDPISAYKYLMGRCQVYGARSFQQCPGTEKGTMSTNCNTGSFHLNMRKNFLTLMHGSIHFRHGIK